MDKEAWHAAIHGVTKSRTRLSNLSDLIWMDTCICMAESLHCSSVTHDIVNQLYCFSRVWLCNPMDCSLPGSPISGILQARILEWVSMPSSRGSSQLWDRTHVSYISCIDRWVLYHQYHLGSLFSLYYCKILSHKPCTFQWPGKSDLS